MSTKNILVLIDGDIFRYRCGFAAERTYYLVDLLNANEHRELKEFDTKKEANQYIENVTKGVNAKCRTWSRKDVQPLENCLQIVKGSLQGTLDDVASHFGKKVESRVYLSGKANFRESIATTKPYKGNREANAKPTYYTQIGDYIEQQWGAIVTKGIEADDALGIAAMEAKQLGHGYVIVSNDKDLDQIPGDHYNWTTKEFYNVSPREAKTRFFIQVLAGDATDNIPGLPGVGEITATKILSECKTPEEMVDIVWDKYAESIPNGKGAEYFLEQANLVYILKARHQEWVDTKEGIYWEDKYNSQVPH